MQPFSSENNITVRLRYPNTIGKLSEVTGAIAEAGGRIGSITIVRTEKTHIIRDFSLNAVSEAHASKLKSAIQEVTNVELIDIWESNYKLREGGKLEIVSTARLKDYVDLSMACNTELSRISSAIHKDQSAARVNTIRNNIVGIVTNGSSVLGLGNIGSAAALPLLEGKAVLFKELSRVNAFPICLDVKDTASMIEMVRAISCTFGAISLEAIAAPACFEIERELTDTIDIPILHDNQHSTAAVMAAALINALKITGAAANNLRAVVCGAGAVGTACARMLLHLDIGDIVVCDRKGAIHAGRNDLPPHKRWLADNTNSEKRAGDLSSVLEGSNIFIGAAGANILRPSDVRVMEKDSIVFVLSNPVSEIDPEELEDFAAIVATGRSEYPNQINNALCFPGLFRGLLESRAQRVTREMLRAAAKAIADVIPESELRPDYIIPGVFNDLVASAVSSAVVAAANSPRFPRTPVYFEY